jgi:murein DD-endopeptidase MepM/ murein hydrolase activator NlpD
VQHGDATIRPVRSEPGPWLALVTVSAWAAPGPYVLAVHRQAQPGAQAATFAVLPREFGAEYLRSRPELLDPEAGAAELARLQTVWSEVSAVKMWAGAWSWPLQGRITSRHATRRSYNGGPLDSHHTGVDIRAAAGTSVLAPARGRVAFADRLTRRGNCVWLDHGWGVYSGYFHLSQMMVGVGQDVEAGTAIGTVGSTGLSTGPHLHWEVRVNGRDVDPEPWTRYDPSAVPASAAP